MATQTSLTIVLNRQRAYVILVLTRHEFQEFRAGTEKRFTCVSDVISRLGKVPTRRRGVKFRLFSSSVGIADIRFPPGPAVNGSTWEDSMNVMC